MINPNGVINNLSLKTSATHLLSLLNENPELLTNIRPQRFEVVLKHKPKAGEKIHSGKHSYKRSVDFEAVDIKADLEIALRNNDHENIAISYYTLAYLIGYLA